MLDDLAELIVPDVAPGEAAEAEVPEPESAEDEAVETPPAEGAESSEDAGPAEGDGGPEDKSWLTKEGELDLRKAAPELRKTLNTMRETDPKTAKAFRAALGEDLAYKESFNTPEEARLVKAEVEAIGGREGLASLQSIAADVEETDALVEAGDPKVLERIQSDSPEGFKLLVPHAVEMYSKADPEGFSRMVHPYLVNSLIAANVPQVFDALVEAATNGDSDSVKKIASNLTQWLKGQQSQAQQLRGSQMNPERDKISAEWKKINEAKDADFNSKWQASVGSFALSGIERAVKPYSSGLSDAQRSDFIRGVVSDIQQRLSRDAVYTKQEAAILRQRDPDKVAAFKNAKIQSLIPSAVQAVAELRRLSPSRPGATAKTAAAPKAGAKSPALASGSPGTPTNPIKVQSRPNAKDIDPSTPLESRIAQKAKMGTGPNKGRWVTWSGR